MWTIITEANGIDRTDLLEARDKIDNRGLQKKDLLANKDFPEKTENQDNKDNRGRKNHQDNQDHLDNKDHQENKDLPGNKDHLDKNDSQGNKDHLGNKDPQERKDNQNSRDNQDKNDLQGSKDHQDSRDSVYKNIRDNKKINTQIIGKIRVRSVMRGIKINRSLLKIQLKNKYPSTCFAP